MFKMTWKGLALTALAVGSILALGLMLEPTPAYAESGTFQPPLNLTQPEVLPVSRLEAWRNVAGRDPQGVGNYKRADKLFETQTFTDVVRVQNLEGQQARYLVLHGYFAPTLSFAGWQAPQGWTLLPGEDPNHYLALFEPQQGIETNQVSELAFAFTVKSAGEWPKFSSASINPQAEHTIHYAWFYETLTRAGSDSVQSELNPLPEKRFGYAIDHKTFQYVSDTGGTKTVFSAVLDNPYVVNVQDMQAKAGRHGFNGATGDPCETQVFPDIRTGQVRLEQGSCPFSSDRYPHLEANSSKVGYRLPVGQNTCCLMGGITTESGWGTGALRWRAFSHDHNNRLVVQLITGDPIKNPTVHLEIMIPKGQALQFAYYDGQFSKTTKTLVFWNDGVRGWLATDLQDAPLRSFISSNYLRVDRDSSPLYLENLGRR